MANDGMDKENGMVHEKLFEEMSGEEQEDTWYEFRDENTRLLDRLEDLEEAIREAGKVIKSADSLFSLVWHRGITQSAADCGVQMEVHNCLGRLRKLAEWL